MFFQIFYLFFYLLNTENVYLAENEKGEGVWNHENIL